MRMPKIGALPTSLVLVTIGTTIAIVMQLPLVAILCGEVGLFSTMIGCVIANEVRYSRMEHHELAAVPISQLKYICRLHPEIDVTFYDSVRSGNCMLGTRGFVKRTFRGRRSITLKELAPYVGSTRVQHVAIYKLMRAEVDWKSDRAGYSHARLNQHPDAVEA